MTTSIDMSLPTDIGLNLLLRRFWLLMHRCVRRYMWGALSVQFIHPPATGNLIKLLLIELRLHWLEAAQHAVVIRRFTRVFDRTSSNHQWWWYWNTCTPDSPTTVRRRQLRCDSAWVRVRVALEPTALPHFYPPVSIPPTRLVDPPKQSGGNRLSCEGRNKPVFFRTGYNPTQT